MLVDFLWWSISKNGSSLTIKAEIVMLAHLFRVGVELAAQFSVRKPVHMSLAKTLILETSAHESCR